MNFNLIKLEKLGGNIIIISKKRQYIKTFYLENYLNKYMVY